MNKERKFKKDLLTKTIISMTNISPSDDQIIIIEDVREDFKNLSGKLIKSGIEPEYLKDCIKHLENSLMSFNKSLLVGGELLKLDEWGM